FPRCRFVMPASECARVKRHAVGSVSAVVSLLAHVFPFTTCIRAAVHKLGGIARPAGRTECRAPLHDQLQARCGTAAGGRYATRTPAEHRLGRWAASSSSE